MYKYIRIYMYDHIVEESVWLLANELVVAENSPHPVHIQLRMHVGLLSFQWIPLSALLKIGLHMVHYNSCHKQKQINNLFELWPCLNCSGNIYHGWTRSADINVQRYKSWLDGYLRQPCNNDYGFIDYLIIRIATRVQLQSARTTLPSVAYTQADLRDSMWSL